MEIHLFCRFLTAVRRLSLLVDKTDNLAPRFIVHGIEEDPSFVLDCSDPNLSWRFLPEAFAVRKFRFIVHGIEEDPSFVIDWSNPTLKLADIFQKAFAGSELVRRP
ncbi:hypothetical protein L3X38_015012 [Prunus dulcis]|uniref:Uncharacterized protein n=1 Tax=Prunus dulcis TaxID=3755 RepID=A0AAD4WPA3_PRUDU|nr:hypothetical protein L3X38_015012 [Prunus dulcis]